MHMYRCFYLPVHVHFETIIEVYDLEIYEIECNKMGKKQKTHNDNK